MNSETKTCQNCKNDFTIESEDFIFYERMKVPAPTFCPECRAVRRLAFRNLRFLYRRKSDFSGEMIFSMYPENSDFPVYDSIEWWSDDWDALEFGQDYDFNKSFFKQFKDLAHAVPRPSRSIVNLENSDYSNNATDLKNCYLVFNANRCEDVVHGVGVNDTRNSVDCSYTNNCELCYDSIFLNRCTRAQYSAGCNDCLNVIFCKNCHGCTDCFGCINLRNKQYYIFNEPYSPEDYETKMREFNISNYDSVKEVKNKIKDFWLQHPVRYTESLKSSNFTGAYIYNSQDVYDSYYVQGGKDIKYCQYLTVPTNEHCYDYSLFGSNASFVYESVVIGHNANNIKFSAYCYLNVRDLEYCMFCHSSSDLFGCIGLRNKQYCIFNKQYTKEEYLALKDKIIQQMKGSPYTTTQGTVYAYGEFFPHEFAPVAYNTSSAFELFPKEKAQALSEDFKWEDEKESTHQTTVRAHNLPKTINEVDNTILKEIIACERTGKPFRVVKSELDLYKAIGVPFPQLHPDERYGDRLQHQLPFKLYKRTTSDGVEVMTPYAPDRPEKILSEKGYQDEVI